VDNVFILVHELDRQNSIHGPGSKTARGPSGAYTESLDGEMEAPSHLPAEERVARTLARMGPSILLSSTTEIVAFGLGALVPHACSPQLCSLRRWKRSSRRPAASDGIC
jgi:Niemann-Pick C1 protein